MTSDCEKPNFNFNFLSEDEDEAETDKDLKSDEDKIMSEIDKFIEDQIPKSTKKKTESDIRKFTAFLEAKQERRPVNIIPAQELNILLSEFIIGLHKDDGEPYEVSTYSGIRYSIERFLRQVKHPQADLSGPEYAKFRAALAAKMTVVKAAGKGNRPKRAMPLTEDEESKLWTSGAMGQETPNSLLTALWWKFTTGFGLRGVQEHRQMQWGDISVVETTEDTYLEYTERTTKTRKGQGAARPFSPKIFCTCENGCSGTCAVALFKLYSEKRSGIMHPAFYLAIDHSSNDKWFKNQPLGERSLGALMKTAAEKAGLQGQRFTNHSARKTGVKRLLDQGVAAAFVAQLTGHKSVSSLSSYAEADVKKQKEMSVKITGGSLEMAHTTQTNGPRISAETSKTYLMNTASRPTSGDFTFSGNFTGCTFSFT